MLEKSCRRFQFVSVLHCQEVDMHLQPQFSFAVLDAEWGRQLWLTENEKVLELHRTF